MSDLILSGSLSIRHTYVGGKSRLRSSHRSACPHCLARAQRNEVCYAGEESTGDDGLRKRSTTRVDTSANELGLRKPKRKITEWGIPTWAIRTLRAAAERDVREMRALYSH